MKQHEQHTQTATPAFGCLIVLLLLISFGFTFHSPAADFANRPLAFKTTDLTASVNANGVITIALNANAAKPIASGAISLFDVSKLFDQTNPAPTLLAGATPVIRQTGWMSFQIAQDYGETLKVKIDGMFSGEDMIVTARLTNHGPGPINFIGFNLPAVQFARNADGLLRSWHWTYLQAKGPDILHPSYCVPIGGAFARDDHFGMGLSSSSHLTRRSLFNASFVADNIIPAQCMPQFYAEVRLEPGDSKIVSFTIRFSPNRDFKHLLANYYADYKAQMPAQQYIADHRPVAYSASADPSWVTADNPFGFNGPNRRLDTPAGAAGFVSLFAPPIAGIGQGLIDWVAEGVNPRGGIQYRATQLDPACFPPPIAANMPAVVKGFTDKGLKIGLGGSAGLLLTPNSPTSDRVVSLDGRNADQLRELGDRFTNAVQAGYSIFYLDSFGMSADDVLVARYLSHLLGPKVTLYPEYNFDLLLPYCGRYGETQANGSISSLDDLTWQIMRWLSPDMSTIVKDVAGIGYPAMYQNGWTPLVEEWTFAAAAVQLKKLNDQYLDGAHWKMARQASPATAPSTQPATAAE